MYGESFFRHGWAIDQTAGVRLKWGLLNKQAVIASLDNRLYQLSITSYTQDAPVRILRALNAGLTRGVGYQEMARGIKDSINATYNQAIRIIRTEGQTAQNAAHAAVYEVAQEQGVKMREVWIATLDDRTRDDHRDIDGAERDADGFFYPGGEQARHPGDISLPPEQRINCRCTMAAMIDDFEPALRRSREDGVIPYQSYKAWEQTLTESERAKLAGAGLAGFLLSQQEEEND
jgi:SPP1 gp7 family putative phage head morphogenesis protein